ncbi:phosphoglycolate phosphatase [Clostridia bacterium]|nr:phosphoglycolate phosphatase [Clostridia bacterium]
METKFRYAVFDLDGTLLNTIDDLAAAGNFTLREMGFPEHDTDAYKIFVGNGIPKLVERMLPDSDKPPVNEALRIFSEYYGTHSMDMTRPYDGITDLLAELSRRGIPFGIVSNKQHEYSVALCRNFFGDLPKSVIGTGEFPPKPDPAAVFRTLELIGGEAAKTLYIGDTGTDMVTAANAGLLSCGVLWGFRTETELRENGAAFIVRDTAELLALFDD